MESTVAAAAPSSAADSTISDTPSLAVFTGIHSIDSLVERFGYASLSHQFLHRRVHL